MPRSRPELVCALLLVWPSGCSVYDPEKIAQVSGASELVDAGRDRPEAGRDRPEAGRASTCDAGDSVCGTADPLARDAEVVTSTAGRSGAANGGGVAGRSAMSAAGRPASPTNPGDAPAAGGGRGGASGVAAAMAGTAAPMAGNDPPAAAGGGAGQAGEGPAGAGAAGGGGSGAACPAGMTAAIGCSCDDPAADMASLLACVGARIRHRYSFGGSNLEVTDTVSAAHGVAVGGLNAVQGNGEIALTGDTVRGYVSGGYVSLPEAALLDLGDVTFEAWFIWRGPGPTGVAEWQRLFDFGTQQADEGDRYLFLTASAPSGGLRAAFSIEGPGTPEVWVNAAGETARNEVLHVAVVVESSPPRLRLFSAGTEQGAVPLPGTFADLAPTNRWLGRSNFDVDPEFCGSLLEFRIYAAALTNEQLAASANAGPDYVFSP